MFPAALFQLASDERGGAPACEALSCLVQSALRRHVLCEKLHLVSEYAAIRENQVFGAIRHVRQIQSSMRAISGVRSLLRSLHDRHAVTTFIQVSLPPRENGIT